jgi:hypothetical protein
MVRPACDIVHPVGAMRSIEPGIHNHEIPFGARWGGSHVQHQHWGLWIPGLRYARPGMTVEGFRARRRERAPARKIGVVKPAWLLTPWCASVAATFVFGQASRIGRLLQGVDTS